LSAATLENNVYASQLLHSAMDDELNGEPPATGGKGSGGELGGFYKFSSKVRHSY